MSNILNPDLINWTESKIKGFLSKELINLDNGSLKLVKIEPQSNYPVHLHPDKTEYAYVLQGAPEFLINNTCHKGSQGMFFIFPAKTEHAIFNNSSSPCLILVGSITS